jgi:transcription termination factor Rho
MSMPELIATAEAENVTEISGLKKQELIFRVLKERVKLKGLMYGEGTLEILPDGFGFLRSPDYHYLSCPDDIYVSPSQIRRFGLRNGNTVAGTIRPPKENERYFALLRVEAINGDDPNLLAKKIFFDDLRPVHPDRRIVLETSGNEIEARVVDMMVPIGFGQRGLIVSPPRAGKTILMQTKLRPAMCKSVRWSSKRQSGWSSTGKTLLSSSTRLRAWLARGTRSALTPAKSCPAVSMPTPCSGRSGSSAPLAR